MAELVWWGHSTAEWVQEGLRLLTDPVLTGRVAHLRRRRGPAPRPAAPPDLVLISHLHADHLHLPSLRRLTAGTVLVPAGAAGLLWRRLGAGFLRRCVLLRAGQSYRHGPLTVHAVPALHHRGRHPWSPQRAAALGYVVEGGRRRVWFAGDTGLHPQMRRFGPVDLALVPVGGWGPTLGAGHLDPADAAVAAALVGAAHAVPIHYGTLWPYGLGWLRPHLFFDPGELFRAEAARRRPGMRVSVPAPGGAVAWDLPAAGAPRAAGQAPGGASVAGSAP